MSCMVTVVLEITECFSGSLVISADRMVNTATDPNTRRVETTTSSSSLLLMLLAETIYHGYGENEAVMDVGNIMVTGVKCGRCSGAP